MNDIWGIWILVFGLIAGIGLILFHIPLIGKKHPDGSPQMSTIDYMIRGGVIAAILADSISKLCLLVGWDTGWMDPAVAVALFLVAVGIIILLIKFRHARRTAALQPFRL